MYIDGTGVTRLTNDAAEDARPAWSPDGARIAFESDRDGQYDIYVMNADGSGLTRLTDDPANDVYPAWSPDGMRIAFASGRDEPDPYNCQPACNFEIYVMNADGSGVKRLTVNPAEDFSPAWSPDGARLAFDSNRDGNYEIYVMNANGSGVTNLSSHGEWDVAPAWSPDGKRIAFSSDRDGNWEIYDMSAGGSGVTRLTVNPAEDDRPSWSPEGSRILFASTRHDPDPENCDPNCNHEIYVMNADGSGPARLTDHPAHDWDPAWSPD